MSLLRYSFIIPVYNRPEEIEELLISFTQLAGAFQFEIVIVEDGSSEPSDHIIERFVPQLNISYYSKPNSGPGDSRNYGMHRAKGEYFIILDSDVLLPQDYLSHVDAFLRAHFYHCFGGPDAAHPSFTNLQKAINFVMTSFITTGGIRGGATIIEDFQPRSFNMGLSKAAFLQSNGFGRIHPGEDPDLALRLQKLGYKTALIKEAKVFHKRRVSWHTFYKQVYKFGMVRPILNQWHPASRSIVFWLPTLFCIGILSALSALVIGMVIPVIVCLGYFLSVIVWSTIQNKSVHIGLQSCFAVCIQFFGYGTGFLSSTVQLLISKKTPQELFPKLFF